MPPVSHNDITLFQLRVLQYLYSIAVSLNSIATSLKPKKRKPVQMVVTVGPPTRER